MKMRVKNAICVALMTLIISTPIVFAATQNDTPPHISSISPTSAMYGTKVVIIGNGFDPQNNDIGFTKVSQKESGSSYDTGYINNVPSKDGQTLVFELPQSVGVCPFSTMGPDAVCVMIAFVLDEGEYEVFVVNKNGKSNAEIFKIASKSLMEKIQTRIGELTLTYGDGLATIRGTLQRSTPCVDWRVDVSSTKDLPPSHVEFHISDKNKDAICIQVLGKPQEISATSMAGEQTNYKVMLEDEVVFSGMLADRPSEEEKEIKLHMKIKKHLVLLSLWNNGEDPVYGVEIEAGSAAITSIKSRKWESQKIDNDSVSLHTSDRPLTEGKNLIILLRMDDSHSGLVWKIFDKSNNVIDGGAMIPK